MQDEHDRVTGSDREDRLRVRPLPKVEGLLDEQEHATREALNEIERVRSNLLLQLSQAEAQFRFDHSRELAARAVSALDSRTADRISNLEEWWDEDRIREWFGPDLETMARELKLLEEQGLWTPSGVETRSPTQPMIADGPEIAHVGGTYTILGSDFGDQQGSLRLRFGDAVDSSVDIQTWSDEAVIFVLPATIGGLPFDAACRLALRRSDYSPPLDVTATWSLTVKPLMKRFASSDHVEDSGSTLKFWKDYEREVELQSAPLPSSWRPWVWSMAPDTPGAVIYGYDRSELEDFPEDGVTFRIVAGPYVRDNRLSVMVRIEDDYYWDYYVCVNFLINVPKGLPIHPDWGGSGEWVASE